MRKNLVFTLAILCCLFIATSLSAQATRTWVSGVGDDVNPCSRTAPCKTFAGAISKTAACGEISVLDPGGFGAVTVTKSITLNGTGTLAGILNSSVNGVLVSLSGAGDACNTVIIRNISINGAATLGASGVRDISSIAHSLHIEETDISHQQRGVDINVSGAGAKIFMKNVDIRHTTVHGIDVRPTAGQQVKLSFDHVRSEQSNGDGLHANNDIRGTIRHSMFQGNNNGVNVVANTVLMTFIDSVMSQNTATGFINGSTAVTLLDHCNISNNVTGLLNNTGGSVFGFGNNSIAGNGAGTDVVGTAVSTASHP